MDDKLLSETKKIVKSLIIPYQSGIKMRQLCDDFFEIEGKQLPYRELGYGSLTEFLKSIPDVLRMYGAANEPHNVIIFPVADESTRHIQELVGCQKKQPKKGGRGATQRMMPRHRLNLNTQSFFTRSMFNSAVPTNYRPHTVMDYSKQTITRQQPLLQFNQTVINPNFNRHSMFTNQASNLRETHSNISRQQQPQQTQSLSKPSFTWQNFTISKNVSNNENMQTSGSNISLVESKPTAQPLSGNEVLQKSQSPFLPPDIKARIEKMMTSPEMSDGIMLYNFEAQYRHCYKEAFEWKKLDFNSLADCLKSLPHIVNLIPAGTSTFKIIPRHKESSQQQQQQATTCDNTDSSSVRKIVGNTETIAIITTTTAHTTVVTIITTSSVIISTPTITTTSVSRLNGSISSSKVISPINSPIKSPQNNVYKPSEEEQEEEEMSSAENTISSPSAHMSISTMAASNFRRILSRHKDGIPACLFAREYQKEFGVSFDSTIWGFVSPMEMFYSLSSLFAIQPPTSSHEALFPGYGDEDFLHDARHKKFDIPNDSEKVKEKANLSFISHIPDIVTAQVLKLIESNMPQGLALPHFTEEYRINYGSLNLAQFHIPNTRQLFELLEHVLPISVRSVEGMDRAFLKSALEVEAFICSCNRQYRYTFAKTMITDIPNGVVLPGEQLRDMTLPSDITVGKNDYAAVLISSAKDPSNIWVQFKGDDYHTSLEQLMTELEFYEKISDDDWRVPKQFVCINYPVVARFPAFNSSMNCAMFDGLGDRNWHRARILRLHAHNSVTIAFVDYGGITTTSINNLHLMKRDFLALETQAMRVGLYGIKPSLGPSGWTISSRDCLLDRFSKPEYFIACTFMEKIHDRYYLVVLCDTNDPNSDIFIHDILIEEKHAVYDEGLCAQNDSFGANNSDNNNNDAHNNTTINIGLDSTVNITDNSNLIHEPPVIESSAVASSSSDKLCVENDSKPTVSAEESSEHLLENSSNHLLGSTEELSTLPPPLVPLRASIDGDSNKVKINMDELVEAAQKVISESSSESNLVVRKDNTPRKLSPSITITRNSDTGERKVHNFNAKVYENGNAIGVKNLERLSKLDLTPTNSDVDETETDNLLIHNVSDDIDLESISKARMRPVIINQVYCHLIKYKDKYYFTYNAVNEIFKDLALWQTIRKSGGYLKERIQLTKQEGMKLFTHLTLEKQLIRDVVFLYPHDSVLNLARINKLVPIKSAIITEVKKFHEDLLIAEKSKLMEAINQIDQKIKSGLKI